MFAVWQLPFHILPFNTVTFAVSNSPLTTSKLMPFINIADIRAREIVPGYHGRFIHSDNITIAYWDITKDSVIPTHSHVQEMMVNVLEGKLELTIGNETKIIEPGDVGIIPSQVPHSAKAITDCRLIDVFYPVREDYK